ncbi:hypothetical protein MG296_03950 [Flavobacteriaceae bacterium TK19130]|nr:hypothetical protein [Thermobacterium salinum]
MTLNLHWKKKFFSNQYRIFENGREVGHFKDQPFSNTTIAGLKGQKYTFKTTGFFKRHTEVLDASNTVVAEIEYGNWMRTASISIKGDVYSWKYDNTWNTKWSIRNHKGIEINYAGSSTKGEIKANVEDTVLVLAGLFITNYYWQTTVAVMIAIMIPIMVS